MPIKELYENLRQRFGDRLVTFSLTIESMVPNRLRKELRQRSDLRWLLTADLPNSEEVWNYLNFQLKGDVGAPSDVQLKLLLGSTVNSLGASSAFTSDTPSTTTQPTNGGERVVMTTPATPASAVTTPDPSAAATSVTAPPVGPATGSTPGTAPTAPPASPAAQPSSPPAAKQFMLPKAILGATAIIGIAWVIVTVINQSKVQPAGDGSDDKPLPHKTLLPSDSDTTPPGRPTNLRSISVAGTQIILTWDLATDNVGVTAYRLYRGGALVETITAPPFVDSGLTPGTTYIYTVSAGDAVGNFGQLSIPHTVATAAPPKNRDDGGDGREPVTREGDIVEVKAYIPDLRLIFMDSRGVPRGSTMIERISAPHPAMDPRFPLTEELDMRSRGAKPLGSPPVVSIDSAVVDKIEEKVKPVREGLDALKGDVGKLRGDFDGFRKDTGRDLGEIKGLIKELKPTVLPVEPKAEDEKKSVPAPEPPKAPPPAAEPAPAPKAESPAPAADPKPGATSSADEELDEVPLPGEWDALADEVTDGVISKAEIRIPKAPERIKRISVTLTPAGGSEKD